MFRDRRDAGARLATALEGTVDQPALVLGIPRGGVIVALPVAVALRAPLDVIVPRKLGAPHNAELGIGAVAPGVLIVDDRLVRILGVPEGYIEGEAAAQESEIHRRVAAYRGKRPPLDFTDRTVVVVDDGVATGVTAIAALRSARKAGASRVVFAAPVGPAGIEQILEPECDACTVLETPASFGAVGEWYERFAQVSDDEVRAALDDA
ncbi:MAG: phosphoribosyltransferase [Actinomycetota bacterium]|nr:phosphoribosyltransferase [Actinomycetota bacterium]